MYSKINTLGIKKITLDGNIYKKFFEIADKIEKNIEKDVSLLNISINMEKIAKTVSKGGNFKEGEIYGRIMHYAVLDNILVLSKYLDNSKEVEYLRSTFVGIFEILEINNKKIIFLDISTGKEFEIIGEGEGSEYSLEKSFSKGDLVISRLIKLDDGWYNMKNFYFLIKNSLSEQDFENLKMVYKQVFYGIKDMLDIEIRMDMINNPEDNVETNINYFKRLKKLLLKPLGKKKYKIFEKILQNGKEDSLQESLKLISSSKINNKDLELIQEYIISFLNENIKNKGTELEKKLSMRLQMAINNFFDYLKTIGKEVQKNKKLSEKEIEEVEKLKIEWFNTKNSLYSNKTPLEFIHEIDSEYDISNLVMQQFSPEELEFYDGYDNSFTEEENKNYEKGLEKAKKQDASSYKDFEKLMNNHGNFFRLRANYIMTKYHFILDKYLKEEDKDLNYSLDELTKDREFVDTIKDEIKYVKKLKKGYIFADNFEGLVEKFNENLLLIIGMKSLSSSNKEANDLIKNSRSDKEIINYLEGEIKYFTLTEMIDLIKKESSTFISYVYEENNRYKKKINGLDELKYQELFEHLWGKNKKKGDYIFDDAQLLYNNILTYDKDDNFIWNYKKIDEFIKIINKLFYVSNKEKILDELIGSIDTDIIVEPDYILENIEDKVYSKKFKKVIEEIGYKWGEYDD